MGIDKSLKRYALAFTTSVIWGLMSPIDKSALTELSVLPMTTPCMIGAATAFWILFAFRKQGQVGHRDMLEIFFASLFASAFNQGMFIFGLSLTSPIDASIVTTTLPIVTMIMAAIYLKEPVTNEKVLGISIGAVGALILILSSRVTNAGGGNIWGDLLCMIAQLSFSIYLTVFKGLSQCYLAITTNKWIFIYTLICYIPSSYQDIAGIERNSISTATIYQVLYVILCGSFVVYIYIMTAQKPMRPTVVSMYNYVQPIVASIAAILMGIGSFDWERGAAITLVFLGVYSMTQGKSKADLKGVS